jgi:hypothetical protein
MLEKIEELRKVQDFQDELIDRLEIIIRGTSDPDCQTVCSIEIIGDEILAKYLWNLYGEDGYDSERIPIKWLEEGFDYKAAYERKRRGLK